MLDRGEDRVDTPSAAVQAPNRAATCTTRRKHKRTPTASLGEETSQAGETSGVEERYDRGREAMWG